MNEQTPTQAFAEWGIVELMGHQRTAGKLSEQSLAGVPFLRVDIPDEASETGFVTKFYGPSAIYCLHVTDEAAARLAASACDQAALSTWSLKDYVKRQQLPEPEDLDDFEEEENTYL